MAVVSSMPAIQRVERVRYPVISPNMAYGGEIVEEPVARMVEDMIYVAVAKDVKDSKSTLVWAVHNSGGKKILLSSCSPAFTEYSLQQNCGTHLSAWNKEACNGSSSRQIPFKENDGPQVEKKAISSPTCTCFLEGNSDGVDTDVPLLQPSPNTDPELSTHLFRSRSATLGQNNRAKLTNPAQDLYRRVRSANMEKRGGSISEATSSDGTEGLSTPSRLKQEGVLMTGIGVSRRSVSGYSSCSSALGDLGLVQYERTEGSENGSTESHARSHFKELNYSSPPSVLQRLKCKARGISGGIRRGKAEKDAIDAIRRFFTEFSFTEIEEATRNFDPSLKIGEGGYGSIFFKGSLRHTQVAIKLLHAHSMQGPSEFQQEALQSCHTHWCLSRILDSHFMSIFQMEALKIDSAARKILLHCHSKLKYALPQSCALSLSFSMPVNLMA
ncbi:hypothetical protein GBA52_022789 [Prunus armeniaca]|nr:hypothetical protein GBA52_022789 [Prunus armeniaca]